MQIQRIDTAFMRPEFCGVFLVFHPNNRYSIIEAGSTLSVPPTLAFLKEHGVEQEAVCSIFVTHAHLDHMGGVGTLAAACSNAIVYCHPQARPHVVNPLSKLVPAAIEVYGKEVFEKDYPNVCCIPENRVVALQDNQVVDGIECIYTPGHAFHHCCFIAGSTLFSGDGFGFGFKQIGMCPLLCTSPSQYDGATWAKSAQHIIDLAKSGIVQRIEPTHFDCFEGSAFLQNVGASILRQISAYDAIIEKCNDRDAVKAEYLRVLENELQEFGSSDVMLAYDLIYGDINVDGLFYRVQKRLARK